MSGEKTHCMTLEIHATCGEVMFAVEALQRFAQARGLPEKTIFNLALALEEAGSNIVNHALLRDNQKTFHVMIEQTGDIFLIELRDCGPQFDPTIAAAGKLQTEEDVPPGGWGIQLIRRSLDEVHYRREAGENVLRLIKRLDRPDHPKPIT